ncbi:TRAP transporter small permease [Desulfofustis glycolicus]|uniref:TRAP-type C4-dicarboxylate transport system, small permease component n=1 Tax=Desulfofustis glycolicus DSM 9705 TaxID=1121409 RepID=A0A1M5RYP0_9BACT|nr:TRAP transporter small permease [Desulfofustis glycolicus]MCB2216316.1 TRAP transporter small permease [Desulfobulbaceae bacterium]SHH31345.1 TRAP-type C4-dicarboxylate transport system, small permease component [Desulfofustis glycolicus DSM 9705]
MKPAPASSSTVLPRWIQRGKTAMEHVDRATAKVLVAAMGIMAVLVCAQVFFRYVLSSSIDWADEISRLMFVWSMFLAIPHGVRAGVHVGIDVLVQFLGERSRNLIARAMLGLSAVLSLVVFYYALIVVIQKWEELMPTVDITASVYYIPVLFAMLHSFFHLLLLSCAGPDLWRLEESS